MTTFDPRYPHPPSVARANGRQAVAEAIQNHMDRLGANHTRAVYSPMSAPRMGAASKGDIARAQAANLAHPNTTFFTPKQSRQADRMAQQNNPLGRLGSKAESWLQLKQVGQQAAQMFNPTTRAGLVNIASGFVGGPKGDASPMMGELGMPGQFRDYGGASINPLERGLQLEGSGAGKPGAGIRGLIRRAQGVGGYRGPNRGISEMSRLEALRKQQEKLMQTHDSIKNFSNERGGAVQAAQVHNRMSNAAEQNMGAKLIPYRPMSAQRPFVDRQTSDFSERMVLHNLQQMMPGNSLLGDPIALKQALYDMLFSGKGLKNIPRRPGG